MSQKSKRPVYVWEYGCLEGWKQGRELGKWSLSETLFSPWKLNRIHLDVIRKFLAPEAKLGRASPRVGETEQAQARSRSDCTVLKPGICDSLATHVPCSPLSFIQNISLW